MRIIQIKAAGKTWWRKPLALVDGRAIPAELAVLALELRPGETGVWMNSRSTSSGVRDLEAYQEGRTFLYKTRRHTLPAFVSELLKTVYKQANVKKGCADLVIWNEAKREARLVEVKCPHWDSASVEQERFLETAEACGLSAKIVEWEFEAK